MEKRGSKILRVLAALVEVEIVTDRFKASDPDHRWKRSFLFVQAPVYDQRVEFIRKLAWLPVTVAVRDFPLQMQVSALSSSDDSDIDLALFGEIMNRELGKDRLRADDI